MSARRLTDSSLRNRIRQLRRERRWTLRRLCQLSGVPVNTICRMEGGNGTTLRNALRIAGAFQLFVYEIWETPPRSETDSKNRRGANGPALTVHGLRGATAIRLSNRYRHIGNQALRAAVDVLGGMEIPLGSLKKSPNSSEAENGIIQ